MVLGQSLYALRLFPALACTGSVIITALIARSLGGKRFAVSLAALSILCGAVFWGMFSYVSPNAYNILLVALAAYFFILAMQKKIEVTLDHAECCGRRRDEHNYTMIVFAFGLVVGILLTSERKIFRSRYPYIAAVIAFAMFIPHVFWQIFNDWHTREFIRNAAAKNLDLSLFAILRPLAIAIVVFGIVYFMNHSKFYYFLPYCRCFWLPALLLSIEGQRRGGDDGSGQLPLFRLSCWVWRCPSSVYPCFRSIRLFPMHGCGDWEKIFKWDTATPKQFRDILDSGSVRYWLWGPRQYSGKILIVMVSGEARIEPYFRLVTLCATYEFPYVDDENRIKRIYVCRDSKVPLPKLWQRLKECK